MKYDEIRDSLVSGDICFYHDSNPFASLIRWKTKSNWDHVGIVLDWGGRKWLCEAAPFKGAHIMILSQRLPAMIIKSHVFLNNESIDYAFSEFDKKYSYLDATRAGLGWRTTDKGLICSEYVGNILRKAGETINEWGTTPELLFQKYKSCDSIIISK